MSYVAERIHQSVEDIGYIKDTTAIELIHLSSTIPLVDIQEGDIIVFGANHTVNVFQIDGSSVTLTWVLETKNETSEWERLRAVLAGGYLVEREGVGARLSIV